MASEKQRSHPIVHDIHYGTPEGCTRHDKLSVGRFRERDETDASNIVELLIGRMCTNKMLKYLGANVVDRVHRYVYSYDSYTLGVVEFPIEERSKLDDLLDIADTLANHVGHYATMPHSHSDAHRDAANATALVRKFR